MADARLLHKKGSHGERVIALGHLEFRVWAQYVLSADDYGVMRASASVLRADNPRLEREPFKRIVAAMRAIVDIGLVEMFEHQGIQFWWQTDWQDFQNVRYPRDTVNPSPSQERLETATPKTQDLFGLRTRTSRERLGNVSETTPIPAHVGGRQTLTLTQTPRSGSLDESARETNYPPAFETFWDAYPKRIGKGAALKAWQKVKSPVPLEQMIAALEWQCRQEGWIRDGGKFIPHPATWINGRRWEDEVQAERVVKGGNLRSVAWRDECAVVHGGRCTNVTFHEAEMAKAEAS